MCTSKLCDLFIVVIKRMKEMKIHIQCLLKQNGDERSQCKGGGAD